MCQCHTNVFASAPIHGTSPPLLFAWLCSVVCDAYLTSIAHTHLYLWYCPVSLPALPCTTKYRTTPPTGTTHNPSTSKPQSWYIAPTGTTVYVYLSEGFRMRKEKINASICTPEQRWFGKGTSTSIWDTQQHCIINLQWCITSLSGWMWRQRLVVMHKIGPHTIFWVRLQLSDSCIRLRVQW